MGKWIEKGHCDETSILCDETQADLPPEPAQGHARKIDHRRCTMPGSRHSRSKQPQRFHELNHIRHNRILRQRQPHQVTNDITEQGHTAIDMQMGTIVREQTRDHDKRGRIRGQN